MTSPSRGHPSRRRLTSASVLLLLIPAVVACGTGQVAQTAEQVSPRAGAQVGQIAVLDIAFPFRPPVAGDQVYGVGDIAPVTVTIANTGETADRLLRISSPVASAVILPEDTRIPGGLSLTAGQEGPVAAIEAPDEKAVGLIALAGLREPIRSGRSYPVVFTFERAGEVLVHVPVEIPDVPRSGLLVPS